MISVEQIDQAIRLISKSGASYAYFFDQLKSPKWIAPLRERGLFSTPPKAQRDGNYISFPSWPASRYLVRMAVQEEAQDEILGIITTVETDNARVQQDFIDAALAMSPERAARLVARVAQWLRDGGRRILVREIGQLVVHLARGGQTSEALDLLRVALSVPMPATTDASRSAPDVDPSVMPAFLLDDYDYTTLLDRAVPELVEPAGQQLTRLLATTLDAVIRLDRDGSDDDTKDQSLLWQPTLADSSEFRSNSIRASLFEHLRGTCVRVSALGSADAREVIATLREHRFSIFSRLQLYLFKLYFDVLQDQAEIALADKELFDLSGWRGEYAQLVERVYPRLNDQLQSTILNWISEGPETEGYVASRRYFSGQTPDNGEISRYVDTWKRNWLSRIQEWLTSSAREEHERLVAQLGQPGDLDEPAFKMSIQWGVASPRSSDELTSLDTEELVEFLQSWEPSGSPFDARVEGLADQLTRIVAAEPERFALAAMDFISCKPEYIRALLHGFDQSVRAGKTFPWDAVVQLCLSVVVPDETSVVLGRNSEGSEGRITVIRLIDSALGATTNEVPFELRALIWRIIASLSEDEDPTPEYESTYGGTNMDPYTLSLNTVRGGALNAVFSYAHWVRRQLGTLHDQPSSFDTIHEVREVLDAHLDAKQEQSLTIRSVYGRHATSLIYLDRPWFSSRIESIFPTASESRAFWESAWGAYLLYGVFRCSDFDALLPMYLESIRTIDATWQVTWHSTSLNQRLAEHLMIHYVCGNVTLGTEDDPLVSFFDRANVELRQHAMEFVGRWVRDDKGDLSDDDLERLVALWESRYVAAEFAKGADAASKDELVAFGWWFASDRFEDEWALEQLQKTLVLSKRIDADWLVVERLSNMADRFPNAAVSCLGMLIEADAREWSMLSANDGVSEILSRALASGVPEAASGARALIHRLGMLGRREYRSLLDG